MLASPIFERLVAQKWSAECRRHGVDYPAPKRDAIKGARPLCPLASQRESRARVKKRTRAQQNALLACDDASNREPFRYFRIE